MTNHSDQSAELVKKVLSRVLMGILAPALALYLGVDKSWGRGLALGGLASSANFFLMAVFLVRSLDPKKAKAQSWAAGSALARFALMGLALALAFAKPAYLNPYACAAGLLAVQIVLLADRALGGRLLGGVV